MAFQFVFDPNRCTGCQACVVGCWMENRASQGLNWRQVHTFNPLRHPALPLFHLSLACHHCEDHAGLNVDRGIGPNAGRDTAQAAGHYSGHRICRRDGGRRAAHRCVACQAADADHGRAACHTALAAAT